MSGRDANQPREAAMEFDEKELKNAILGLAGSATAAADQAQAMSDYELGHLLTTGRWSTIEIHEAGRRLIEHGLKDDDA